MKISFVFVGLVVASLTIGCASKELINSQDHCLQVNVKSSKEMLHNLAYEIETNDIGAALRRFYLENELNRQVLMSLDYDSRVALATELRNAEFLEKKSLNYLIYVIKSKQNNSIQQRRFGVIKNKFGNWVISFW